MFAWYRRAILRHYPALEDDLETGGMASFIEEVGMDVGVLRKAKSRIVDRSCANSRPEGGVKDLGLPMPSLD